MLTPSLTAVEKPLIAHKNGYMNPMDLSNKPPRKPRAELAGIVFLPRSIDKACATLPGGDPGPYNIPGFTGMMLEQ